jgi:hypothetical protein
LSFIFPPPFGAVPSGLGDREDAADPDDLGDLDPDLLLPGDFDPLSFALMGLLERDTEREREREDPERERDRERDLK